MHEASGGFVVYDGPIGRSEVIRLHGRQYLQLLEEHLLRRSDDQFRNICERFGRQHFIGPEGVRPAGPPAGGGGARAEGRHADVVL